MEELRVDHLSPVAICLRRLLRRLFRVSVNAVN
jgi:hypothetical protein